MNSGLCPSCQAPTEGEAKFCGACGTSLAADAPEARKVSRPLLLGIVLMPYIFAWATLRSGYSSRVRKLSLGWMGLVVLLGLFTGPDEGTKGERQRGSSPEAAAVVSGGTANCTPGTLALNPETGQFVRCAEPARAARPEPVVGTEQEKPGAQRSAAAANFAAPQWLEQDARRYAGRGFGAGNIISLHFVEQVDGPDRGGLMMQVAYRVPETMTRGLSRHKILSDIQDFLRAVIPKKGLQRVQVFMFQPHVDMVDSYGNQSDRPAAKIVVRRATAERINWSNMTPDRLERLIRQDGQVNWHPALR